MKSAVADSEETILSVFSTGLDLQTKNLVAVIPDFNTRVFYTTMVFMAKRKELFCLICSDVNNQGILYQMVEIIFPGLEIT